MAFYSFLPHRALIAVSGDDRFSFLQGLVSNDMRKVERGRAVWAALLTPQGKFLHEFFVFPIDGVVYLECEHTRRDDLLTRLSRYKLRSKVEMHITDALVPGVAWGDGAAAAQGLSNDADALLSRDGGIVYRDPRLAEAGVRWALPTDTATSTITAFDLEPSTPEAFDDHRLALGLPDGSRDMEIEKALLLESGFEELHGVDFQKGCYMGQELTARTHYRALIKKRLMPVTIDGPVPAPGTALKSDGAAAGEMKSARGTHGLALIRIEAWKKASSGTLDASGSAVTPVVPAWMILPGAEEDVPRQP
jgi:folate-binding protein YgfZ